MVIFHQWILLPSQLDILHVAEEICHLDLLYALISDSSFLMFCKQKNEPYPTVGETGRIGYQAAN